jgi:hypothetical protein
MGKDRREEEGGDRWEGMNEKKMNILGEYK